MNSEETKIVVVDGADGLTPDMLRQRKPEMAPEAKEYEHNRRIRRQFE
tara:strand:- start:1305 stop:1448 length:144 start_codon:yes stop_codon:yes gene_type:complete